MVAHEVPAGRGDLDEHAGDLLHGVDPLRRHEARVVVAALGEVQHFAAPGEQP